MTAILALALSQGCASMSIFLRQVYLVRLRHEMDSLSLMKEEESLEILIYGNILRWNQKTVVEEVLPNKTPLLTNKRLKFVKWYISKTWSGIEF